MLYETEALTLRIKRPFTEAVSEGINILSTNEARNNPPT